MNIENINWLDEDNLLSNIFKVEKKKALLAVLFTRVVKSMIYFDTESAQYKPRQIKDFTWTPGALLSSGAFNAATDEQKKCRSFYSVDKLPYNLRTAAAELSPVLLSSQKMKNKFNLCFMTLHMHGVLFSPYLNFKS